MEDEGTTMEEAPPSRVVEYVTPKLLGVPKTHDLNGQTVSAAIVHQFSQQAGLVMSPISVVQAVKGAAPRQLGVVRFMYLSNALQFGVIDNCGWRFTNMKDTWGTFGAPQVIKSLKRGFQQAE